ncbi:DUF1302 domain-containing protein [Neptunomonas concharum]|uniref:DUF1302 domain-containing protein n=1 Tax=Neptunomonas concharum TaxID=1031538 RepID=A0A5P1RER0_9GAMM|nr:DUF1302 domain-containing protein [Neptunomonas concharum]QEQ97756.1 DUF1302 domain-containing protein [Neptunomonas concharum]
MAIKNTRVNNSALLPTRVLKRKFFPALLAATLAGQAHGVEFQLGEIDGRFDSQLSVGASWRLNDPDSDLFSEPNGGTGKGSGSFDDGNQNFKKGETFSKIFKGTHELSLSYQNFGAFVRGKYWADFELKDGDRAHGHTGNGYIPGSELNDDGFNDFAKFSGAELLDAYIYGNFELGDKPLDLRLGRQVVNWGESTFIQGGINVINPFDVSAFRRPGSEVKEGLLPVNMAFASLGLTDNLSVEAFYQLGWEPTVEDGCGTYFSANDFAAEGCNGIRVDSGAFNGVPDSLYFNGVAGTSPWNLTGTSPVVARDSNGVREAKDGGQFGLAARYLAEDLNDTEFGFYFAKYHSRLPIVSGIKTDTNMAALGAALTPGVTAQVTQQFIAAGQDVTNPAVQAAIASTVSGTVTRIVQGTAPFNSRYFTEYPEDIKMLGFSWNTNIGELAWSGEISHKQDVPIQLNGPMLVASMLTLGTQPGNPANGAVVPVGSAGLGDEVHGYKTFSVTQAQSTVIKTLNNVMGASRLALIGELGWTHIHDFDESAEALKFGRSGVFGYTPGDNDGFVTQDSFGYVVRAALSYPNAFAGVNLTPQISFKHGISGYGPQPGAAFNEGQKSINLSLTADYLERYSAQLSYTNFFGGDFNELADRDFISLSASVSF